MPEENAPAEELRYTEAVAELERILRELEEGEMDLDRLAGQVERAVALVRVLKERIRKAEMQVKQVVAELEEEVEAAGGEAGEGLEEAAGEEDEGVPF